MTHPTITRAHAVRAAACAADLAADPTNVWLMLRHLEALQFVIATDLSDEIAEVRGELRPALDSEGYHVDWQGDRTGDRYYVPYAALSLGEAEAMLGAVRRAA